MKKILLILILLIPFSVFGKEIDTFSSSGTCTILMDMDSKRILYGNNIHTVRSIASITKIMTAIIAIENGKIDNDIVIGDEIEKAYGSGIYIKQNEEMKLIDLVYGLMLRSGNDAALSIAKIVSGNTDEFVKLMNEKATSLKMSNTVFNNPSGLDTPKSNYSTTYDMALLTSYAMQNETYRKIVSTKKYKLSTNMNTYIWHNKNKLLSSYKYATGGKTGFTEIAKRTLVTTASKDNMNLVVVTLNDGNDFSDHKNLYEEAFETYSNYKILKEGNITIYNEKYYPNYEFYIKNDFNYTLTEEETSNLILKFEIENRKNDLNDSKIGVVSIKLGDSVIHEEDLYIKEKIRKKSFLDKVKEFFNNLW